MHTFAEVPNKTIIGRLEQIELSELELGRVKAKVDTGAYRSSLHCRQVQEIEVDGKKVLKVKFQIGRKRPIRIFKKYSKTRVKSSNGTSEERFVVQSRTRLGSKNYKISFTLTDRSEMKYPILIGRKFISGKFLVDASASYLLGT